MFIYSKSIQKFIQNLSLRVKSILSFEVGLRSFGNRFYNKTKTISYPIKIVIYNNKSILGYFDSCFLELGFHECLMRVSEEELLNIIRHEIAHYLTFIEFGDSVQAHSVEFRTICKNLGWGKEVYEASSSIDFSLNASSETDTAILRKIKKLMSLASSSNIHEAEQAMLKSRELLLKHNIDNFSLSPDNDETLYLKRILKQKRESAKMRATAHILSSFFVNTVYTRGEDGYIYLEILGTAIHIEIAEYVANFLQPEFERLWDEARGKAYLQGTVAKNSFFLGVAKGYCSKIEAVQRSYTVKESQGLMVIEKQLTEATKLIYRSLRQSKSAGSYCGVSSAVGQQMGQQLNINPALKGTRGNAVGLLTIG